MFKVNYLRGKYIKRSAAPLMPSIVARILKSGMKSCFDRVSFSKCSYNVISLCCVFASQEISLCRTAAISFLNLGPESSTFQNIRNF